MSNINDFKLLNIKCISYFEIMEKELQKTIPVKKETDPARFGFYIYILENITGEKELPILLDCMTDTEFCASVLETAIDDNGVDAIYIDEDEKVISLFNFKFREKFNKDSKHSKNDVFLSTKFTNALISEDTEHLTGRLQTKASEIIDKFSSNEIWKMKLFIVSNESNNLDVDDGSITQLEKLYDLEIISISLSEISDFMSLRPTSTNASLVLDKESILSYTESSLATTKSYILKLSIPELLRITCNNSRFRDNYQIEDYSELYTTSLDYNALFDNVRGYLGNTKYNLNIINTLKEEPNRFFMYNNGLTITTKSIEATEVNVKKKLKLILEDIQVVNGGQTLRTLHKFNSLEDDHLEKYLSEAEVLVRIFKTGNEPKLTSKIAEFTNSQNSISPVDLKSISYEQIQIEQFFDEHKIIYARKSGDTGLTAGVNYTHKISMEKFAQILFSIQGNPDKASNQKKRLFDKYYSDIFGEAHFDMNSSLEAFNNYYQIKDVYDKSQYLSSDQKIFYILYLQEKSNMEIIKLIDSLENCLVSYRKNDSLSPARKLLLRGFKEFLDNEFNI